MTPEGVFKKEVRLYCHEARGRKRDAPAEAPTLVVRVPAALRRRKVVFTLHSIPLVEPPAGGGEF